MLRIRTIRLGGLVSFACISFALSGCGGGSEDPAPAAPATTFKVGGSVTGLSGSVVLKLNGANDLTVSSTSTFTFGAALDNNAGYAVTIAALPASQVCGVTAGGNGTISGASVTNVAISCANYSVGGTVTGLTGSGLKLQFNGGNDLDVAAASSSFVFPSTTSLGIGGGYGIYLKTQPSGQTCTIIKSTGIVSVAAPTVSGANAPVVACVDNITDVFSGTYQLLNDDPLVPAYLTFNPDGTFIFGIHADDSACGASHGNGIQYGVYNWNQTTQTMRIVTHALDTVDNCGLDVGSTGTLTKNTDGTLSWIVFDNTGPHESVTLTPVASTTGSLIGSWGTNQLFIVYASNGKLFSADTRSFSQIAAFSPGIENGCYALTGTTASGSYTVNFTNSCAVSSTQTGIDTTHGGLPFAVFGANAWNFTVTGDSMQATVLSPNGLTAQATSARILPSSLPSSYSITATISGLTASGLVLQNNGGSSATVASGATSSIVATGIDSGRTYGVTVRTQPTGQFCTVANGRGILFANVTNVAVSCATVTSSTYTVGGTVTGLTGTGFALRLNGQTGPAFNVNPAAGSYAFTAGLQTGAAYSVIVAAQPTTPTQLCFPTNVSGNFLAGTIGANNVSIAFTCVNSVPYKVSGPVGGLTGSGLSLRMIYTDTYTATVSAPVNLTVTAGATTFSFANTIPANGLVDIGIVTQPIGQTCTITKGRSLSIANFTGVGVACVNNTTDPLSGTYSFLDAQGRGYVNFNADGTYTTALIHNDWRCNTGTDMRNGNGVEYGVFSWTQATGTLRLPVVAVVDTNGDCGLSDNGPYNVTRVGNTIELREFAGGPLLVTTTPVESTPSSLVGAFVLAANDGSLLVFHADGTFMFADPQLANLYPLGLGQERGCYTIAGSTVTLTIDASCRPDDFAAYDLNGPGGFLNMNAGVTTTAPLAFTINDADTVTLNGRVFKRTKPN